MESLVSLENLSLPMDGIREEGVEILGALPSLCYLNVQWDEDSDEEGPEMEAAMVKTMEAHPNRPTLVWTYQ
jgi:disease resistance protein RPM1